MKGKALFVTPRTPVELAAALKNLKETPVLDNEAFKRLVYFNVSGTCENLGTIFSSNLEK